MLEETLFFIALLCFLQAREMEYYFINIVIVINIKFNKMSNYMKL